MVFKILREVASVSQALYLTSFAIGKQDEPSNKLNAYLTMSTYNVKLMNFQGLENLVRAEES